MSNQTIQNPETIKPLGKPPRPVRLPILYGFLAAGIVLVIVELILFPNLASNLGFLALAVFTSLFSFGSMGLTFSGLRPQLPKAVKWAVGIGLWGFVALDIIFLVLPSFISGPAANDQAVTFVSSSAASATTAPAVATTAITTASVTTVASQTIIAATSVTTVATQTTAATVVAPTNAATTAAQTTVATKAPAAPQVTTASTTVAVKASNPLAGMFNNAGAEPVSGKATIGKTADGKFVLRFEGLNSAPGPDLVVYLSKVGSPSKDGEVRGGIEVGKLKSTKGDQNYELPTNLDLSQYKSVVVYCKSFNVVFGFANLG